MSRVCGGAITAAAVRKNFEGRLRSAGITISDLHDAQISMDLDCAISGDADSGATMAVHQCLAYSEVVSAVRVGKMLAATWRNCQSYICRGGRCDSQASSATDTLVGAFLSELQRRTQAEPTQFVQVLEYIPPPIRNVEQFIFYTVFMMACLSMLFYWHWRRPRSVGQRAA